MYQPSLFADLEIPSSPHNSPQSQRPSTQQVKLEASYQMQNLHSDESSPELKTPKSKRSYKLTKTNPESQSPSKTKERKLSKIMLEKQKNTNQLFGHWNIEQNKRYHWFLEIHFSHFMNRSMRRMDRIFTLMAKFVGTREAEQCRSHHQKMQKKHKTFPRILLSLRLTHYETGTPEPMMNEMHENNVDIIENLLTHEDLVEKSENVGMMMTPKSSMSSPEKLQKQIEPELGQMERIDFVDNHGMEMGMQAEMQDGIEAMANQVEMWGLQLESSKNYSFKLQLMQGQKARSENLLDPDYDNKLDLHNFFLS